MGKPQPAAPKPDDINRYKNGHLNNFYAFGQFRTFVALIFFFKCISSCCCCVHTFTFNFYYLSHFCNPYKPSGQKVLFSHLDITCTTHCNHLLCGYLLEVPLKALQRSNGHHHLPFSSIDFDATGARDVSVAVTADLLQPRGR